MLIGTPLIIVGGLSQPMSLTKEEAWAAGINQQKALADKQAASPARLQMFIGLGFACAGAGAGALLWCISVVRTFIAPGPEEEADAEESVALPQQQPPPPPIQNSATAQSPPDAVP